MWSFLLHLKQRDIWLGHYNRLHDAYGPYAGPSRRACELCDRTGPQKFGGPQITGHTIEAVAPCIRWWRSVLCPATYVASMLQWTSGADPCVTVCSFNLFPREEAPWIVDRKSPFSVRRRKTGRGVYVWA
jgi:hypothetical protein